jgi:multiple sugar transport system ATP-binding protein
MADVILKNVMKEYEKGVVAVRDFNLDIKDKEFIVLVGPSGCGKSTTLRMIAGLEEITSGELYVGNKLVNNISPKDRDIAMVFQNYALYPHMTVYDNIAFGLKLRRFKKEEINRRVIEAAHILGIEELLDRKPKALSGGQRQRVALGRAMVRDPAVFLLDEPLSNLDAKLRASMRTEIIKLHKKLKTTFVYVTHDQIEAMTMGDRIVVMKDGVIQQIDTPQNLYDHPSNLFVAGFIGSPQMNFMDGILENDDVGYHVTLGSDRIDLNNVKKDIASFLGKKITVGIRPEDIMIAEADCSQDSRIFINANVEVRELMGAESYLHLNYNETQIIARVPTSASVTDASTIFCIEKSKLYLFDDESGAAILSR